jgi:hypothetical protein
MFDVPLKVPGPRAPAFLRLLLATAGIATLSLATPAAAQQLRPLPTTESGLPPVQQPQQPAGPSVPGIPPASARPVPDQLQMAKLLWTTMAAVDHANKSGNYSVLRDISSTAFQINNDPSKLAQAFATIRNSRIDVSNALLVAPTYSGAPQQLQSDVFRVQGVFSLRPIAIGFDMFFQWERGEWRLFGIDLRPLAMADSIDTTPRQ